MTTNAAPELGAVTIEPMIQDDLELALGTWAKDEGWNPGKFDALSYFSAYGPEGFLILKVDGKPVGSISLVRLSESFAFIGAFIVIPEYRGKGLGTQLFTAAMNQIEDVPSVGLYAVPAQVDRYARFGFSGDSSTIRLQKTAVVKEDISHFRDAGLFDRAGGMQAVVNYDMTHFPADRRELFWAMLEQPQSFGFVSFDAAGETVTGFALVRPLMEGYRIGPLYASDIEAAKLLFRGLLSSLPDDAPTVVLDAPENNSFIHMFAEFFDLAVVSGVTMRAMFRGDEPEDLAGSIKRQYAVASLELG